MVKRVTAHVEESEHYQTYDSWDIIDQWAESNALPDLEEKVKKKKKTKPGTSPLEMLRLDEMTEVDEIEL